MKKNILYILVCTLLFGVCSCSDDDNVGTKELKVFSMTPTVGVAGDEVTIMGQGFSIVPAENNVTLNDEPLVPVETSVTMLKMKIPYNLQGTFPLMITTGDQTVEGPEYTYTEGSYDIKLQVDPLETASAYPGDLITITGKGFCIDPVKNEVSFGTKPAKVVDGTATSLTVEVPELAPGDYVITIKADVQVNKSLTFSCLAIPELKVGEISPASGREGTEIIITGENFSTVPEENVVTINGKQAVVKEASAIELKVVAPANPDGSYKVVVTVKNKSVEGPEFTYVKPELNYTVHSDVLSETQGLLNGIAVLPDGRIAVAQRDDHHRVFVIDPVKHTKADLVNKHAGSFPWNICVNHSDNKLYIAYKGSGEVGVVDPSKGNGQNVTVLLTGLPNVMDVRFDTQGNMYVLCRDERTIYKYAKGSFNNQGKQKFATISGGEGLYSMDFDAAGNLIVGSQRDGFYAVSPSGAVTKIAGSGNGSDDGVAGKPLTAKLVQPEGIVVDKTRGDIYFTDGYNNKIRRIRPGKNGYTDATVSTVVGNGSAGKTDGDGTTAKVSMPNGITMTADGKTIYFTDMNNNIVRRVSVTEQQ